MEGLDIDVEFFSTNTGSAARVKTKAYNNIALHTYALGRFLSRTGEKYTLSHLEPNVWLHFHCHGGDGRTTSFLAMYDMIRNANNVEFEDIIARQAILGPENLAKLPSETSWKFRCAKQRLAFLQYFYEYVRVGYGREAITRWLDGNPPVAKRSVIARVYC